MVAGTATANINLSATVKSQCTVVTDKNLYPISYDPVAATDNNATQATVTVTCGKKTPFDVVINGGAHSAPAGVTGATRGMTSTTTTDVLGYDIVDSTSKASVTPTTYVGQTANGLGGNAYGLTIVVPKAQDVDANDAVYTDTVTVTVNYY